jgi:hypothetical protein
MEDKRPRSILLYLCWIGALCGTLLLLLGDVIPVRLVFVRPETLFVCLLEVELAFVVFVWPWFIPSLLLPEAPARRSTLRLLREVGLLLVASLPPAMIAANVSNVEAGDFLLAQALLWVLGAFAAALFAVGSDRRWAVGAWYVLGAFAVSSILPFTAFIASSLGEADLAWLARISPFWAVGRGEISWPVSIYGVLAVAIWTLPRRPGRIAT